MEVVIAAGILLLVIAATGSGLDLLRRAQREFEREQRALLVLDNVVERLGTQRQYDEATVRRLLGLELAASGLAESAGMRSAITRVGDRLLVRVLGRDGKAAAQVRIPCPHGRT